MSMSEWITLLEDVDELDVGSGRCFEVRGKRIAVFRTEEGFHAIDDLCTHAEAPLSDGMVENGCVVCPWHGAQFDLRTGEAVTPPAVEGVKVYKVVCQDDELKLEWGSNGDG